MSKAKCSVVACDRPAITNGYCSGHDQRIRKNGSPGTSKIKERRTVCSVAGCGRRHFGHGLCKRHYNLRGKPEPPPKMPAKGLICSVEGCNRPRVAKGFCGPHHRRWNETGDPGPAKLRIHGNGHVTKNGYRMVVRHGHPNANCYGRVVEHWLVMSEMIGRPIRRGETIHHKNGDRLDNRPENLELWRTNHPPGQRVQDRVRSALRLLKEYADVAWLWPAQADELRQALGSYDPNARETILELPPPKHVFTTKPPLRKRRK